MTIPPQLFIYYAIPIAELSSGLLCAKTLIASLDEQGLGTAQLFQRQEKTGNSYQTLMEVIDPAPMYWDQLPAFRTQLDELAIQCFSGVKNMPHRHTEVFWLCGKPEQADLV